jgi:aldose 1-epimerase
MPITRADFGKTTDAQSADLFTLTNANDLVVKITNFGARITELHVPDRNEELADIVLGFDNLGQYLAPHPYFGTTVGRVANRIDKGSFQLDGTGHRVTINDGPHALHGGTTGIDRALWTAEPHQRANGPGVDFFHVSPHGDQGFPGNLSIIVRYTLTDTNELRIEFEAESDKATPVNLSHHSYFNLAGAGSGPIYDHLLRIHASRYTPVNGDLIPTGELLPVAGTVMDFAKPMLIGSRINDVPGGGYDHNYVVDHFSGKLAPAARVEHSASGRTMDVSTNQPGIQFYSGNFLDGSIAGIGGRYEKHGGFCLETQHFPDSVNQPHFPTTILRPGKTYRQTAVYKFGVIK